MHRREFCICRFVHREKCDMCRFVISAFGKIFALQICAFCAQTVFAHLQIWRFAHLHICTFVFLCLHLCEKFFDKWKCFANMRAHENFYFSHFSQKSHFFPNLSKISKKSKFPKMSDSVPSVFDVFPKMSEKSSRVPEWYTSGSWANAFDNTGWQKSPEYALIRIAAGAPDLAKSPNPPPDGPGRPRKSRHFSLRTEKLPDSAPGLAFAPQAEILSGAVFPDPRTTRPSRQTDSEARRVLRQSPTHSANVRTLRKTLAENRRQGQRHSCTPCTPCTTETEPCTLVHNRATTPRHKWQRTHRPCVALVGEEGGAERPRAIESIRLISSNLLYNFNSTISMYICYSRYATR